MKISRIHIEIDGNPLNKLMSELAGRVFHVTKEENWLKIYKSGEIVPNLDGRLETSFGSSKNSYFKNKGCVSVFDYRNIYQEKPQEHMHKCSPTLPLTPNSGIAILLFKPEIYLNLWSWEGWENENIRQMVVPYVEAGYFGSISLLLVDKVIIVTMSENKNSLTYLLQKALENNCN